MPGRHPPLQTLLDMPPNSFVAKMLANSTSLAHVIIFFNLFCLHCLHELFASNLKPLCGDNLLGAAISRGFVVASITDSTCNLLCLMAWGHCIALIQLCMVTIPFPPWQSCKEAFAS